MCARRAARDLLRLLTRIVAGLAVLGALGLAGLWAINVHVLPSLLDRVTRDLAARCGCSVSVGGLRFRPFRGLILTGPAITTSDERLRFTARSAFIRLNTDAVFRLRHGLPALPRIDDLPDAFAALAGMADAGFLPTSVVVADAVLTVGLDARPSLVLDWSEAAVRHERRTGMVHGTATGSSIVDPERSGSRTTPFAATAHVDYREPYAWAEVDLAGLPIPVAAVRDGEVRSSLSLHTRPGGGFSASGTVAAAGLSLHLPLLAPDEIAPLDLWYEFDLTAGGGDGGRRAVTFHHGALEVNGVSLSMVPAYDASDDSLGIAVRIPATPVGDLLEALPAALLGPLETLAVEGTFALDVNFRVPTDAVAAMTWVAEPRLEGFAVRRIGARVNPFKLNGAFIHVIEDPRVEYRRVVRIPAARLPSKEWTLAHSEHTANQVTAWRHAEAATRRRVAARPPEVVGRNDPPIPDPRYRYVRLEAMSPWIVRAVLTAEDGDFFFHPGVNVYSLVRAIERNLEAGEVVLGASTISMQLVKMLFLDDQRILARKLQEAFLVYLMEHEVPVSKERILEIYLNIAEFGPGVFGIADAASYYFRKHPRELTAGEATWLASILPSPKRFHAYYDAGGISDGWFIRMKSLFDVMLARGRMTQAEHRAAIRARPRFWFEPAGESDVGSATQPAPEAGVFGYSLES